MENSTQVIVAFHISRGGQYGNPGHKTYLGEKTFQDIISENQDKLITDTLIDRMSGIEASYDDIKSLTGTLDFDGEYDTYQAKSIEECNDEEIKLIVNDESEFKSDELKTFLTSKTGFQFDIYGRKIEPDEEE